MTYRPKNHTQNTLSDQRGRPDAPFSCWNEIISLLLTQRYLPPPPKEKRIKSSYFLTLGELEVKVRAQPNISFKLSFLAWVSILFAFLFSGCRESNILLSVTWYVVLSPSCMHDQSFNQSVKFSTVKT